MGGQAVIEGVMMRTPHAYAVAVRRRDGSLEVKREGVRRLADVWRPLSWPIVRGFAVLCQALYLGIRTLNFSFTVAARDAEGAKAVSSAKPPNRWGEAVPVVISMASAGAFAVLLFILAPLWIATWLQGHVAVVKHWLVFNLVDGVIRVAFFLAYLLSISLLEDIRRVFRYHGAEHKVVHAWEAREELTVDNARCKSRLHPRCGTSFLLFVMVVSIVVFSLVKLSGFWALFLSRVVLIPLIAGISYELIRLSARSRGRFFRLLVMPGLALQRITTGEPSDEQLAVAIHALKEALEIDAAQAGEAEAAA